MGLARMTGPGEHGGSASVIRVLVMGVSGSGKSTLAASLSVAIGAVFIEGDDHHSAADQDKMRNGIALNDDDRMPWLIRLGSLGASQTTNVVLSCSALKTEYRSALRAMIPGLKIVFLELDQQTAHRRVSLRSNHTFPARLVANQFATLESPAGEPGVLSLSASDCETQQLRAAMDWLMPA
ncbi:carbohydrate kinase, thermoresistant glucokinase family protein [Burkholderia gladioli]|uniref:Gluconokinase n=2 Tax=Burkholderia gladioli TaxID=28095 RepID=A0AAW3EUL5_BURGA|nr:gluconokinase, GntK/IdnK-type [Burkholderia gladioli]AJW99563.1 carbohydrate kinase, thermoresistant glucokinase family protein [Burkholderia gladioli]KGC11504.1 carbohydrate kinase, thermoresistant glucokinase family protein [Burkholderia gladioli]